ncbi:MULTISPECIES: replication-associated recombination protein A [unclassified Meiothermus]|uniref:replication-associated recombination protein A n=1 Tax=unclassified Meiothermus TaxID=370471 RepID=UPI000D7C4228|nr:MULTISPECIES: replication-associated recombination protein A [unclassified Meiothermus]PZA08705.1 replication-associated recombination protein A [Meiothermus sp. Pnk-1]RYM40675.1 replication-associated recombination protein A [Meiothermus sp. PNK-Is4]
MERRPDDSKKPLAERMRPRSLEEVLGQPHLTGPGKPLRRMLESGRLRSLILWGPPGSGKTTLARLLAEGVGQEMLALSAVDAGVKEIKEAVARAREVGGLVLFLDEIHRFNKSQQDALLPHVESGLLTLIGATTENPSFEVNPALRSRARVYVLRPLEPAEIRRLLERALQHPEGLPGVEAEPPALELLAQSSLGDVRRALSALELAVTLEGKVTLESAKEALGAGTLGFDKGGEHFYDLISALHKSVRGNHVDAALYYLARMLEGGADPLYLARRLVRMAVEDVGLADPLALRLAVAAQQAYEFLGSPEGELALAELTIYLALAPKSNSAYTAWKAAQEAARRYPDAPVPLHLRNAPTALMKSLGYGQTYAYYHDDPQGSFAQAYLPEALEGLTLYEATGEGWEERVRERLGALRRRFRQARPGEG